MENQNEKDFDRAVENIINTTGTSPGDPWRFVSLHYPDGTRALILSWKQDEITIVEEQIISIDQGKEGRMEAKD